MHIGAIDFFGTSGLDVAALRAALPVKPGDGVEEQDFDRIKGQIGAAVLARTGKPMTGLSGICCDADHRLLLYIGLHGTNASPLALRAAPVGTSCLEPAAVTLYDRAMTENQRVVTSGDTAEDHSRGYALSHDPGYRTAQESMRRYAVAHANALEAALRACDRVADRRAAAHLLGYAEQSRATVGALVAASRDPDSDVRNNAIRALWVVASSTRPAAREIPGAPFVAMLNSTSWEDRNKGGLLLSALTDHPNATLLDALRHDALDSLIEMARWQDAGHADAYRLLLGRMAGIEDARLRHLIARGDVETIVAAVLRPR